VKQAFTKNGAGECSYSRIFMINSRKWKFADGEALKESIMQDVMAGKADEPPAKKARR